MHLSHPYEVVDSDEVFPFRYGKDAFDYIQRTHQMAFTDSLTELGNRNAYETSCVRMAHDFDSVRSLCLILFDLNGMKRVNDTWGHLAGIGSLGISPRSCGKPCLPPPNCTATAGTNSLPSCMRFRFPM